MPKKRKRIMVVMTPAAYKVFEEWIKNHPQCHAESCAQQSAAGQPIENKEVSHESNP